MKKVKIGLAGCGVQHNAHMMGYKTLPNVKIVAACALPEHIKPFAKQWGISKIYTDLEKLCKDPKVDVIDIALPNYLHSPTAVMAAENGKAVLCEKPLAVNAKEGQKMVDAVKKYKVFNAYTENYTFFEWAEEAKRNVESGVLGKPVWLRSSLGTTGPYSPWFFNPEESGGGCLVDLGCHFLEMHRWILGKKVPVEALGWADTLVNKEALEGGTEDYSFALVKYEGAVSLNENSWGMIGGEGFVLEIAGTEGWFSKGTSPKMKILSVAENTEYLRRFGGIPGVEKGWFLMSITRGEFMIGMAAQMQHIVTSYLQDVEPRHTFKDGLVINKIMDAVYKSAKTKKYEKIE